MCAAAPVISFAFWRWCSWHTWGICIHHQESLSFFLPSTVQLTACLLYSFNCKMQNLNSESLLIFSKTLILGLVTAVLWTDSGEFPNLFSITSEWVWCLKLSTGYTDWRLKYKSRDERRGSLSGSEHFFEESQFFLSCLILPVLKYKVNILVGNDSARHGFIIFQVPGDLMALFQSKILLN